MFLNAVTRLWEDMFPDYQSIKRRSDFEEYFVPDCSRPSYSWNSRRYTSLVHSMFLLFTNDTCVKYPMSSQAYKVVNTNACEISGWGILSRLIHSCAPRLGGINCYVQSVILFLTWPPWIPSVPNIGGWYSLPGAEARGALGTVPSGLRATLITSLPNPRLIFSGSYIHSSLPYHNLSPYDSSNPVPTPISAASCAALIPSIYIAGWSHHLRKSRIPGICSAPRHKSMIGRDTMYCANVFWWRAIYTSIYFSPTVSRAAPMVEYIHAPLIWHSGSMPTIRRTA